MGNFWSDNPTRVERLRELAAAGLKSSEIAAKLHITRNAVIGKCGRAGIKLLTPAPFHRVSGKTVRKPHYAAKSPGRRKKRTKKHPLVERLPMRHTEERQDRPVVTNLYLSEPGCLWPMWADKPDGKFCGDVRTPGFSYCEVHCSIARAKKEKVSA